MTDIYWYNRDMNTNPYILFLDDERHPSNMTPGIPVVIARSFDDFVAAILCHDIPVEIHFDHDLGLGKNGHDCARWLTEHLVINELDLPEGFQYFIHSQNPIGARNIDQTMKDLLRNLPRMKEAYHQ